MSKATNQVTSSDVSLDQGRIRSWLALGITGIAIVGIVVLGTMTIVISDKEAVSRAQAVFNAVLPLFGTWVGTVLAYFFSRENFESASRSVERLTRQLTVQEELQSMPVASAMVPRSQMLVCDDPVQAKLVDTLTQLEGKNLKRLPILSKGVAVTLIYSQDIIDYLYRVKTGLSEDDRKKLTVQDLLDEKPELKKPFAVVSESGSLADAQDALAKIAEGRVVFVTKTGSEGDPVVGMLTSVDIARNAQA
jgi:predicted transcriptional regulator